MSPSISDPIDYKLLSTRASLRHHRRQTIICSAIIATIAAVCLLDMSESSTKCKNTKWDEEIEVFQMMEYLRQHASAAGDGGNFTASIYNEAASHIAQYRGSGGNVKTGDQVETKYKSVWSSNNHYFKHTNNSSSLNHNTNSL